jgi:hypothetical protein
MAIVSRAEAIAFTPPIDGASWWVTTARNVEVREHVVHAPSAQALPRARAGLTAGKGAGQR